MQPCQSLKALKQPRKQHHAGSKDLKTSIQQILSANNPYHPSMAYLRTGDRKQFLNNGLPPNLQLY
jgi:hypothetical protein